MNDKHDALWDLLYPLRHEHQRQARSLWDAVKDGNVELARTFIAKGHDVNARFMGGTALGTAASGGSLAMVSMLLQAGAKAADDAAVGGPLTKAVEIGEDPDQERIAIIDALIAAGTHESDLRGALRAIAHRGNGPAAAAVLNALRQHGVDAARVERACQPAAKHAAHRGNEQLARFLRAESDDPGPNTDSVGDEVSKLLGGVDINDADAVAEFLGLSELADDAPAPPPIAADSERDDIERALCEQIEAHAFDAALSTRDANGLTPVEFAASHGLSRVLEALLSAGVSADGGNNGPHPLSEAAQNGHLPCVRALLDAGAQPDTVGGGVYTPLIKAAEYGHLEVVRALLDAGANPRYRTAAGETAMHRASGLEVVAIRDLLRQHADDFPSDTDRGLKSAGKVKACEPTQGIAAFLRYMLDGHPEWVLVAARAPLEDVSATATDVWSATQRLTDVARKTVPAAHGVFALQLKGHAWSLLPVVIGDYQVESAKLADIAASALASRLSTMAVAFYGEDTSASVGVRAFQADALHASIDWDSGDEFRFEGDGDPPNGRSAQQRFEGFFSDHELFIPAMEVASDGFDLQLVVRNVGLRSVQRVDYLVLPAN